MKGLRFFNVFVLALVLVFATSCEKKKPASKLLNEKLAANNFFELVEKVSKDTLIPFEEIDFFTTGIARYNNFIDSLYGKTVKEIIDNEKTLRRKQSSINLITNSIQCFSRFRYDGWKPVEIEGTKYNIFTYTVSNISKIDIRKISGYLQFLTSANQLIRAYRINVEQTIKAGQYTQFQSTFKNEENNQNEAFLVKALTENPQTIFVSWRPTYIELDNGQKIDLEQK